MPVLNGFEAAHRIRKQLPHIRIVMVSSHPDAAYVEQAFRTVSKAMCSKDLRPFSFLGPLKTSPTAERFVRRETRKSAPERGDFSSRVFN
jgi:DNA-binding NarL/FixJ family response regulator